MSNCEIGFAKRSTAMCAQLRLGAGPRRRIGLSKQWHKRRTQNGTADRYIDRQECRSAIENSYNGQISGKHLQAQIM